MSVCPCGNPDPNLHRLGLEAWCVGMFVRVVRRTGRVMNPGTFWEMTDGKGDFWQVPPENCVREAS